MQDPEHHATIKVFLQSLQKARDYIRRKVSLFFYDRIRQPTTTARKQIVFVRWDAKLGDTIVTSWLFREIRKSDPSLQLVVIAPESFKSMFLNDFGADRVIVSPKRVKFADIRRIAKAVGPVEYVVHMAEHLRPKDVYLLSKLDSHYVLGLDDEVKGINIKAGARTQGLHFADKVAVLMQHMGISDFDQSYIVPFDSVAEARTDAWWPDRPVIAFNPIGRGHARQFSLKTATAVLDHILNTTKADVLILIDPAQRSFAESIKQQVSQSHRVILAPADKSAHTLGDLFSCVRRSQAMVSVDTATVHIATGLGKPVFGFYNPQQNDRDFNFVNWSPHCERSVSQLAKRVNPQVIDAIDINEFRILFKKFVEDYGLNPIP